MKEPRDGLLHEKRLGQCPIMSACVQWGNRIIESYLFVFAYRNTGTIPRK